MATITDNDNTRKKLIPLFEQRTPIVGIITPTARPGKLRYSKNIIINPHLTNQSTIICT